MTVAYTRRLPPAPLAAWEAEATGLPRDGREYRRREQGTFVSPALHIQRWVIDADQPDQYDQLRIHGFTPESPTSTHVFMQLARNYALERTLVDTHFRAFFLGMLERDAALLEVVQCRLAEESEPRRDINVKADRAAVRARRVVQAMVAEETGAPAIRAMMAAGA
jgi:vanillate O-demethylase monooxygenase subunit